MSKAFCTAIILAAGQGKRMGTDTQKQFLQLNGYPLIYYSLCVFEKSELIDEIILVTSEGAEKYCEEEIVQKYEFHKVKKIVTGGAERYNSVWNGLQEINPEGYVFIHDGARPFVTENMILDAYRVVSDFRACVVGMPVKDTIKVVDSEDVVVDTPARESLWMMQTPQVFEAGLVKAAYGKLMQMEEKNVTDDAQVVELMMYEDVKLVRGSYKNIKITTLEDLQIAEIFLSN